MLRAISNGLRALRALVEPPPVVPCACGEPPVLLGKLSGDGYRYHCAVCDRTPDQKWDNELQARGAWRAFTEHQRRMS